MKRELLMCSLSVFMGSLFFLYGMTGLADTAAGSDGRLHNVIRGDTLWDVSQQYLENPYFWPKVWQYNSHIQNPHLIYPGDKVRIPTREELAQMGVTAPTRPAATGAVGAVQAVQGYLVERPLFESSGYILGQDEAAGEGAIVSSWEEKVMLVERDPVHVSLGSVDGAKVDDLFEVIRVGDPVVHPVTRAKLGRQSTVLGILKITAVEEKLSSAKIVKAYDAIEVGDKVRRYRPQPLVGVNDLSTEDKTIYGIILKNTLGKDNLAVRDTVFIDVGTDDTVRAGDRFLIYRGGEPFQVSRPDALASGITEYPPDVMGELVVLKTARNTATAVIVEELYEITPGDRVKYVPRSIPPIKKYNLN
jgi:hypothetical protein